MNDYRVDTTSVVIAESFRKAEEKIAQKWGGFALFGLFEIEDHPGRWDLVAAAPWLDTNRDGIRKLIDLVNEHFKAKEWQIISTIVPMKTDSDFAQAITRKYHFEHQVEEIGNTYVNGVYVSHAFLITSNAHPSPAPAALEMAAA
jgi:hypothetical protein